MIINKEKGFTLIEIAIVMVIIGLLMGGGVSIFRVLNERKTRNYTIDYLKEVKEALITYADIHGALPYPDTDGDGLQGPTVSPYHRGTIPYADPHIGVQPKDSWSRNLRYEINLNLYTDRTTSCLTLRSTSPLTGRPEVVDADGSGTAFSVAAVIVSAGPMDADSDGDVFDDITTLPVTGDNINGNPYIRNPPTSKAGDEFDDLVTYIGKNELSGNICEYLVLAVNNNSTSTVYVFNVTQGSDIGSIASSGTNSYNILSGTRIEIRDTASGAGNIVTSRPSTPITLSGKSCQIDIPLLTVNNNSASTVYVYNQTQGSDIGILSSGDPIPTSGSYDIVSGDCIKIRNASGVIVPSVPLTPITLSEENCTINVSP